MRFPREASSRSDFSDSSGTAGTAQERPELSNGFSRSNSYPVEAKRTNKRLKRCSSTDTASASPRQAVACHRTVRSRSCDSSITERRLEILSSIRDARKTLVSEMGSLPLAFSPPRDPLQNSSCLASTQLNSNTVAQYSTGTAQSVGEIENSEQAPHSLPTSLYSTSRDALQKSAISDSSSALGNSSVEAPELVDVKETSEVHK